MKQIITLRTPVSIEHTGKKELEEGEMINVTHVFKEKRLRTQFWKLSTYLGRINEEIDRKEGLLTPCGLIWPMV